ncbi:nucleoside/nucleotide kinase family protein [Actinoplanes sp. NPDC049118]|uniref:nucleoside/nucleotide kinase family protein n=1 Tax=Actinoplanes sp. NPDC049118 TaxID=3155769 RepID=UPI00340FD334
MSAVVEVSVGRLVDAARELAADGRRRILGITGAPGAGKSTLAREIADALGERAALVGLDGFHLSNAELHRLGRHARKGAADTFDAAGYTNLLHRLRPQHDDIVYAAEFDRGLEESIACAVAVHRAVPLIITEGNYLLVDDDRWGGVAGLLDQSWYVEPGEGVRLERLVERHIRFGRSPEEAAERSYGSDQRNAGLIEGTRHRAGLVVRVTAAGTGPRPPAAP